MIPEELSRFFWDSDPRDLEPRRNAAFIMERLLEFGDEKAVRWLFLTYSRDEIAAILQASRSLSLKSRSFWRLRLSG